MRVIICENYEEMSKQAAKLVISQVTPDPPSERRFLCLNF